MDNLLEKIKSTPLVEGVLGSVEVKRCHKCGSVFIEDDYCESCGIRLSYDPFKDPFDDCSFYTLKDDYIGSLSSIYNIFSWALKYEKKEKKRYLRQLFKRYRDLLVLFGSGENLTDKMRTFYYIEFKDLVRELAIFNEFTLMKKILYSVLMDSEDDRLYQHILTNVTTIVQETRKSAPSLVDVYNFELAKGLRARVLMLYLGIFIFVICISLLYYPKLLKLYQII